MPNHEHLLQFEVNKAEAKISQLEAALENKSQEIEQMSKVQKQLVQKNLPPFTFTRRTQTAITSRSVEVHNREEEIRELNERLTSTLRENEMLRA